jgi:hypothetical protein
MSKSLKKVALIVGIAALAWTGVGLTVLAGAGSTIGGALAATTFGGLTLGTIATAGLGLLAIGSAPSLSLEGTGANARGTAVADPNALGAYVFGTTTVPPSLVREMLDGR